MSVTSVEEAKKMVSTLSDDEKNIAEKIGEIVINEDLWDGLKKDPVKVLEGKGLTLKNGIDIRVLEPGQEIAVPDSSTLYIRLPEEAELKKLKTAELEDEDLENVVGGIGITLGILAVVGIVALAATVIAITAAVVVDRQLEREHIRKL